MSLKPGFVLGGWLAFAAMNDNVMVMGDLVSDAGRDTPSCNRASSGIATILSMYSSWT